MDKTNGSHVDVAGSGGAIQGLAQSSRQSSPESVVRISDIASPAVGNLSEDKWTRSGGMSTDVAEDSQKDTEPVELSIGKHGRASSSVPTEGFSYASALKARQQAQQHQQQEAPAESATPTINGRGMPAESRGVGAI